jgi:hypothetical protein
VHETLDEQTVIVHLENGTYYSLDPIGSLVWERMVQGATLAQIVEGLSVRYDTAAATIETAVATLCAQLEAESLVVPGLSPQGLSGVSWPERGSNRREFLAPVLNKYTDMQELLLLDPVHEVDDTGWPRARQDGA